jgi:hypothetical protein
MFVGQKLSRVFTVEHPSIHHLRSMRIDDLDRFSLGEIYRTAATLRKVEELEI